VSTERVPSKVVAASTLEEKSARNRDAAQALQPLGHLREHRFRQRRDRRNDGGGHLLAQGGGVSTLDGEDLDIPTFARRGIAIEK
jgi:hypothetical protein